MNIIIESLEKSIAAWENEKFHANAEYDFSRAEELKRKIEEAKSLISTMSQNDRTA